MKLRLYSTLVMLFLCTLGFAAQDKYSLKSQKIGISGTSNLHDWTATIGKMSAYADIKVEKGTVLAVDNVQVDIDANSFEGSKGSIMDNKIKDTFDASSYLRIKFSSTKISISQVSSGISSAVVAGTISIKGKTFPLDFSAKVTVLPNGDVEVVGSKKLKMSDLGLKPPTAMLGTLKTANEVSVNVSMIFRK